MIGMSITRDIVSLNIVSQIPDHINKWWTSSVITRFFITTNTNMLKVLTMVVKIGFSMAYEQPCICPTLSDNKYIISFQIMFNKL